jgi:hypothetical protein
VPILLARKREEITDDVLPIGVRWIEKNNRIVHAIRNITIGDGRRIGDIRKDKVKEN